MAKNVLIATLGESPIVVTSMLQALQAKKDLTIDQLHVLHPEGERLIDLGYDCVKEHLKEKCCVTQWPLPFPDTNSRETSMMFLQILSDLIHEHEDVGDNVYLSVAGGRKNMSALIASTCQFFDCVRGLYHVLDKYEDYPNQRNFHSIEELFDFNLAERSKKLSPPAEDLILVEIPYKQLSNGVALRQYFSEEHSNMNVSSAIEIDVELEAFGREIFQKKKIDLLDVYLSKDANAFYTKEQGRQKNLENCFRSMRNSQLLQTHNHSLSSPRTDCLCFKMGNTDERLFYYKNDSKVIIATIVTHHQRYNRIANGNEPLCSQDHPAHIHSNDLKQKNILIMPLGKSPMVVTQTYALLSTLEGVDIGNIILIYPNNPEIRNGVRLLQNAFKKKNIDRAIKPIKIDIKDVASDSDCRTYSGKLVSAIKTAQTNNPDKSIYLSLSGGRKGMAALTLFAAQQAKIDAVYHTLITDAELENRIAEETTIEALKTLGRAEQVQRLFLENYDKSNFDLFRIPVIPLS